MDNQIGENVILEPIRLESARRLIYQKKVDGDVHYIPSVSVQVSLPLYIELVEHNLSQVGFGPWIIREKETNKIIGEFLIKKEHSQSTGVDIGYYVRKQYRNYGFAKEAISLNLQWLARKGIKYVRATCERDNIASVRVLQQNGFHMIKEEECFLIYQKEL